MNNREKILYLGKFLKAKRKYEYLDQQLKNIKSIDLNAVKTTVPKTMAEKIYDRDKAGDEYLHWLWTIEKLIGDDNILGYVFLLGYSFDEAPKKLGMSKKKFKEEFYRHLNDLVIEK